MRRYVLSLKFKKSPRNFENLEKVILFLKVCVCVCFFLNTLCSQHCMFRLLSELEDAMAWK